MKKIFTLVGVTLMAMSANAQDIYESIVDGKLAPEFAAVAGEGGGAANNTADGKSIVTMTACKATVTAVGGTTPANADGGGQQSDLLVQLQQRGRDGGQRSGHGRRTRRG